MVLLTSAHQGSIVECFSRCILFAAEMRLVSPSRHKLVNYFRCTPRTLQATSSTLITGLLVMAHSIRPVIPATVRRKQPISLDHSFFFQSNACMCMRPFTAKATQCQLLDHHVIIQTIERLERINVLSVSQCHATVLRVYSRQSV